MRGVRVWARLLCVERTVVEDVCFEEDALVVAVWPARRERSRYGIWRRRCRGYDQGQGSGVGGHSTSRRPAATWRGRRRECSAGATGSSRRCRGRGTELDWYLAARRRAYA